MYSCVWLYVHVYVYVAGIDFGEFLGMYKRLFVLSKSVMCVHLFTVKRIHVCGNMCMFMLQA